MKKTTGKFKNGWSQLLSIATKAPVYMYVPITSLLTIGLYLVVYSFSNLMNFPEKEYKLVFLPDNIWLKYLIVVLLGPLLETLFLQSIPYHFLRLFGFMRKRQWLIVLIPAICFGALHFDSFRYILSATILGLFFMGTYVIRSKKGDPFLCSYLLHVFIYGTSVTLQFFIWFTSSIVKYPEKIIFHFIINLKPHRLSNFFVLLRTLLDFLPTV